MIRPMPADFRFSSSVDQRFLRRNDWVGSKAFASLDFADFAAIVNDCSSVCWATAHGVKLCRLVQPLDQ
jgi:hypothetical protein